MENTDIVDFFKSSYELLRSYEKKGRYYHSLTPSDNHPVVVHKKTNQLTTVIRGFGTVFLNGERKDIFEGDIIFIEAGTLHQFFAGANEMILFHIHVPDEGRDTDRYILDGEDYNRFE